MANYYPIMLDVRNRTVLVIGGDSIAAQKASDLAASGAIVTLQANDFCENAQVLASKKQVTLRHKDYEYGDLAGVFLTIAAVTYQPTLVQAIWTEAQERGQLINIVDVPDRCNFIMPSILRRGSLTIAVSTEGTNPSLAKRFRQQLEEIFPPEYDIYLRIAAIARMHLRAAGISYDDRDKFFGDYEASNVLSFLKKHDILEAITITMNLLERYGVILIQDQITEMEKFYENE
jgi:precorrin-2 dehydrogenase/sirohydrochlorin ferrochelatase